MFALVIPMRKISTQIAVFISKTYKSKWTFKIRSSSVRKFNDQEDIYQKCTVVLFCLFYFALFLSGWNGIQSRLVD